MSLSDKVVKLAHEIITKGQFRDKKLQDRPENPDSSFSSITTRRGMLLKISALLRGPCSASSGESTRSSTLWGRLERSRGRLIQQRSLQGQETLSLVTTAMRLKGSRMSQRSRFPYSRPDFFYGQVQVKFQFQLGNDAITYI